MFNIVVNIVTVIIVFTILALALKFIWAAFWRKISGEKVFEELQKRLDLSDSDRNACALATDSSNEEKFDKRKYRHYKVSKDFLLKAYEQNAGRLKFVDRYQLKWETLWAKVPVIVGAFAAIISTGWNIWTTVSENIHLKDGNIDITKAIENTISNTNITLEAIKSLCGIFVLVILTFVMSLLVWKMGNDGFYDKIIKEILEEKSRGGNAE